MRKDENEYIKDIFQLIKSLLNFCKYDLTIIKSEINLSCSSDDLTKVLLFLKDNPSLSMECLIYIAAVDFPENPHRLIRLRSLIFFELIPPSATTFFLVKLFSVLNLYQPK